MLAQCYFDQTEALFTPQNLSRDDALARLQMLSEAYQGFYWDLHNNHRGCEIYCGTMYHGFHLGTYAALLEEMIGDMINKRCEYEIGR